MQNLNRIDNKECEETPINIQDEYFLSIKNYFY